LERLSLAHNKISNIVLKSDPKQYRKLELLDLSNNLLKNILFNELPYNSLGKLDVSHNQIEELFETNLDSSTSRFIEMKSIDASNNKIKSLNFEGLRSPFFKLILFLESLNLGYNQITDYTPLFYMMSLKSLDLSGLSITEFPFVADSKITNLILKDNQIKLEFGIFPRDIEKLDLTRNKLGDTIDENQLIFYDKLETVILNENGISKNFLTKDFRTSNIKKIGISGNNFQCNELAELIKILKVSGTQWVNDTKTVDKYFNIYGFGCLIN
jgi:hypothetical protein